MSGGNLPATSKAWRIKAGGQNAETSLFQVEEPVSAPKRGQVLVHIRATSLNYRDQMILKGHYPPPIESKNGGPIPLCDGAGDVIAVGEDVTTLKVGDKVLTTFTGEWQSGDMKAEYWATTLGGPVDGTLTQYRCFEAKGLVHMPPHLSYEEGATLPCAALTAYQALFGFNEPIRAGQTVLLLGTGGVSIHALQQAVAAGAKVIITSSSDEKLARAKKLGAWETINYSTTPEWSTKVRELTNGIGVDKVLEVGGPGTFMQSLKSIKPNGGVFCIGALGGPPPKDSKDNIPITILFSSANVRGIMVGSVQMFEQLNERIMVAHNVKPIIDQVYAFGDVVKAYQHLAKGAFGKIVIKTE
ncbi:uncharacterized protein L969DRAFT_89950 [Mixia osmundae IAM 14324]|nr:uncharacterized protein L969DRAFT_89950 [Mixia osmundae IAM 14324]KEI37402.1 hypothetical protein L969DRAFT_89950 [Mixia osmundae IAM 14324]